MNKHNFLSSPPDAAGLLSGQYWGELRIFAEVARAKSFNKAAERLGLSQPTIGRKVRRLQDLIGTQLCVATKHGVRLTRHGEDLAAALLDLDQSLFAIASKIQARDHDAEGVVSVSITDGLAAFFAAPAVKRFTADFPRVQLHIKSMGNLNELRDNQTDMMLAFTPIERGGIVSKQVGELQFVPIVSKGYAERHGVPTPATIEDHSFLQSYLYQSEAPVWRPWQDLCARGRVAHYCDNPFAYGMLVKQGLGIGLLGTYATRERSAVAVDLDVRVRVGLHVVALEERLKARPVRLVFDWLCDTFGPHQPWFRPHHAAPDLPRELRALGLLLDPA